MTKSEDNGATFFFGVALLHGINQFKTKLGVPETKFRRKDIPEEEWNMHNYRCDELTSSHIGKHILFTGCSMTYGQGLEKDEIWASQVYQELSLTNKVSGYFNLAVPGSSISFAIIRLFKYFKEFGNPDILVFNMPPIERFLSVGPMGDTGMLHVASSIIPDPDNLKNTRRFSPESALLAGAIHFELYGMLEAYCKAVGIRLISFTWQDKHLAESKEKSTLSIFSEFDTFYDIYELYDLQTYIFKYIENNLADKSVKDFRIPYLVARDDSHQGIIYHNFYKDAILNILNKDSYSQIERFCKNDKQ